KKLWKSKCCVNITSYTCVTVRVYGRLFSLHPLLVMDILKRSRFDKLVEKATNELLIEPDIESALVICDLVRGQEIRSEWSFFHISRFSAKNAVFSIKRRLQHDNPNIILHTLYVLESMMKNCGTSVHEEVATTDFMQALVSLTTKSHDVCTQVLACIQNWAFVFKDKPEFSAIQEAYDELKSAGHTFPPFSENDAMFSVVCAPNWKEENFCHRCKVPFTTFRRRVSCLKYLHCSINILHIIIRG
ncbi:hypothetical protein P879_10815, partial [Paragonimus westermani]